MAVEGHRALVEVIAASFAAAAAAVAVVASSVPSAAAVVDEPGAFAPVQYPRSSDDPAVAAETLLTLVAGEDPLAVLLMAVLVAECDHSLHREVETG